MPDGHDNDQPRPATGPDPARWTGVSNTRLHAGQSGEGYPAATCGQAEVIRDHLLAPRHAQPATIYSRLARPSTRAHLCVCPGRAVHNRGPPVVRYFL